jgi:hypothetical protein
MRFGQHSDDDGDDDDDDNIREKKTKNVIGPTAEPAKRCSRFYRSPVFITLTLTCLFAVWREMQNVWSQEDEMKSFLWNMAMCAHRSFHPTTSYSRNHSTTFDPNRNVTSILSAAGSGFLADSSGFATDKMTAHSFAATYDWLLAPYRDMRELNALEIGVKKGGSLKLWREFFDRKAKIFGMDIDPDVPTFIRDANIKVLAGFDSADKTAVNRALGDSDVRFDVVIDDGNHLRQHQRKTYSALEPYLSPEAVYIMEDYPKDTRVNEYLGDNECFRNDNLPSPFDRLSMCYSRMHICPFTEEAVANQTCKRYVTVFPDTIAPSDQLVVLVGRRSPCFDAVIKHFLSKAAFESFCDGWTKKYPKTSFARKICYNKLFGNASLVQKNLFDFIPRYKMRAGIKSNITRPKITRTWSP